MNFDFTSVTQEKDGWYFHLHIGPFGSQDGCIDFAQTFAAAVERELERRKLATTIQTMPVVTSQVISTSNTLGIHVNEGVNVNDKLA